MTPLFFQSVLVITLAAGPCLAESGYITVLVQDSQKHPVRLAEIGVEKNGGSKLTKKDPKQPVFFILDWDNAKNVLLWHVIYGTTQDDAKLRIAVNASTGEFERVEK